jgi:hypothetical protein
LPPAETEFQENLSMGSFMRGLRILVCIVGFIVYIGSFTLIDTYGWLAHVAFTVALVAVAGAFVNFVDEVWPAPPTPQSTVSSNDYSDGGGPDGWGGPGDM